MHTCPNADKPSCAKRWRDDRACNTLLALVNARRWFVCRAGHGPAFKTSSPPETPTFQAVAAPAQTSLDTATGAATKCKFVLARSVAFGERIAVVGETNELGCWKPSHGLLLQWSEGDVWSGEVCLQPGVHAFKVSTDTKPARS